MFLEKRTTVRMTDKQYKALVVLSGSHLHPGNNPVTFKEEGSELRMDNRDEQVKKDMETLKLYDDLIDDIGVSTFLSVYDEIITKLSSWNKWDSVHEIKCMYGTKVESLSDNRGTNEKIKEFLKTNKLKIRR